MTIKPKKLLAALLATALAFGLFAATPITATAATAAQLADTIGNFDPGNGGAATGQLTARTSGNTVNVTGSVTGVTRQLELNIDAGVKVVWEAAYSGSIDLSMVRILGAGTLEVATGGSIRNAGMADAIASLGANTVIVSGGTVSATAEKGYGICINEANAVITVNGGAVSSAGDKGAAIYSRGEATKLTVNGGTVKATGIDSLGIYITEANAEVTVGGSANVEAEVNAIHISGANCIVKVNGGAVSSLAADTGSGIYFSNTSSNSTLKVSGGTISATGSNWSHAICVGELAGNASITVSGGTVRSVGEYATIHIKNTSTTLEVSGGFIFGYGDGIIGDKNVIYRADLLAPTLNNPGIVCACKKPSGTPTYNAGDTTNLIVNSTNASAKWDKEGSQNGIRYENGANKGFFPVTGVNVNAAAAVPVITGPAIMTLTVGYTATATGAYTVGGSPAPTVTQNTTHNNKITWNESTKKLDIAAGLAVGEYPVILVATSGSSSATLTFTLKVTAASTGAMGNFLQINTYTPGQFTDVDENLWYGYNNQRVIARAYEYGLMKGNSATTFNPTGNITVAEAITMASRVYSIYKTGSTSFVEGDPWYQVYISYALTNGIIAAADFNNYTRAATRAEMVYIFSRSLPEAEFASKNTVNGLPDVNNGTPYYSAIVMLYKAGIVTGNDAQGTFKPASNITRAEAAAIISRVILPDTRVSGKIY